MTAGWWIEMPGPTEIPPHTDCEVCGNDAGRGALCERCAVIVRLAASNPDVLRSIALWLQPHADRRRERAIQALERALAADVELVERFLADNSGSAESGTFQRFRIRRAIP